MPRALSPAMGHQLDDAAAAAEDSYFQLDDRFVTAIVASRPFAVRQPGWPEHI